MMQVSMMEYPEKTIKELQKYLDDNHITLEEYFRKNLDNEFADKVWMNMIYSRETLDKPSTENSTDLPDAL